MSNGCIATLFGTQFIVTGSHILKLEITIFINSNRRTVTGKCNTFKAIRKQRILELKLTAKCTLPFFHNLRDSRNDNLFCNVVDSQCCTTIAVIFGIADAFLTINQERSNGIACLGCYGNGSTLAGQHRCLTGNAVVIAVSELNRNCANRTVLIKLVVTVNIGKGGADLISKAVPIPIYVVIFSIIVEGSNVCDIHEGVILHLRHVNAKPLHIIPRDEELKHVSVAVGCVNLATLCGSTKSCHFVVGCFCIDIAPSTVGHLEDHITGRLKVDFKEIVFPVVFSTCRSKIHLNTTV